MVPRSSPDWTIARLLEWACAYFARHGIDSARSTADILLAHALNLRRIDLYLRHDQPLNLRELAAFKDLVKRRLNREPVAYICGQKEFYSLSFSVGPDVLIPRPETETLVEKAQALIDAGPPRVQRIIDLGTGSGAIVVALACQRPGHLYFATDASPKALALARRNATAHQVDTAIGFFCGNWLDPLASQAQPFHLILSNPPYIATAALRTVAPEVRCHEPQLALDGGDDGLACLRQVIEKAWTHLGPQGWLVVEIGFDQGPAVRCLAAAAGKYQGFDILKDLAGHDRVLVAQRR